MSESDPTADPDHETDAESTTPADAAAGATTESATTDDEQPPDRPEHGGLAGPPPEERPRPAGRRTAQGIRVDPDTEAVYEPRRTVLSAFVYHQPGVLAEVAGLLGRRQFNIESLTVGPTLDDDYARITLVIEEPDPGIEQARKQLAKLVDVVSVSELGADSTHREMALIKLDATHPDRIQAVTEMHDGRVVDVSRDAITVEVTGPVPEVSAAIETFEQFTVREIARTGTSALAAGGAETADSDRIASVRARERRERRGDPEEREAITDGGRSV